MHNQTGDPRPQAGQVSHGRSPALLSAEETARYLNVSARTLASLTSEGIVPSLTIGRRRLYPLDRLDAWVAARVQTGGGQ
jgi:excisionase family DNA binding protein